MLVASRNKGKVVSHPVPPCLLISGRDSRGLRWAHSGAQALSLACLFVCLLGYRNGGVEVR